MKIELVYADITEETTDAIVNAANSGLYAGAGVCGAIHAAAGPELQDACMEIEGVLVDAATGEPVSAEDIAADEAAENERIQVFRDELMGLVPEHELTIDGINEMTNKQVVETLETIHKLKSVDQLIPVDELRDILRIQLQQQIADAELPEGVSVEDIDVDAVLASIDEMSDDQVRELVLLAQEDAPLSDAPVTDDELEALLDNPIDDAAPDFKGAFSTRRTFNERCPEGDAVATPGFDLPAAHVIHAVGPRWNDGESGEVELLDSVHRAIIRVAEEVGAKSVSLPAISTGIFGFPLELAAPIAVNALREAGAESGVEVARITVIDRTNYNAFAAALGLPLEEAVIQYAWVNPQTGELLTELTAERESVETLEFEDGVFACTDDDGNTWYHVEPADNDTQD